MGERKGGKAAAIVNVKGSREHCVLRELEAKGARFPLTPEQWTGGI